MILAKALLAADTIFQLVALLTSPLVTCLAFIDLFNTGWLLTKDFSTVNALFGLVVLAPDTETITALCASAKVMTICT